MGEETVNEEKVDLKADAHAFLALLDERARARVDPEVHKGGPVPAGFQIKATSELRDRDGNTVMQWIKTRESGPDPQMMLDVFAQMVAAKNIAQLPPIPEPTADLDSDLLSAYFFGDPHLGLLSWHLETGADFDLRIAESLMCDAVDRLVYMSPPSETAVVGSVGDTLHADGHKAQTTAGTPVDVDSRMGKVFRVAMTTYKRCIDRALEKHRTVHVKMVPGNHDSTLALFLPLCLEQHYWQNPRVIVDTSPAKFMWLRFGKVFLGITHGDSTKFGELGEIMAAARPQDWGETEFRHWYTGHLHHTQLKELKGCTAETLRTLAPRDAWHAGKGYFAGRSMNVDIWHREYGYRTTHQVGVAELRG